MSPMTCSFWFPWTSIRILRECGTTPASGGVIVMDDSTCMPKALWHMMRFYKEESCGQCTPCREGSGWILKMLDRLLQGKAEAGLVDQIHEVALSMEGRTICAFGEAISWPVTSFIEHFREEFEHYEAHGSSLIDDKKRSKGFAWEKGDQHE